ncbi:uncharacterized protein F5891DRAFT_988543 [Suillus fuscotomentosus]|uniref:Uncharacterized protein n=1 Tax=Suillus fuscotomentosus TaxID=1912939 RepID=A0AAD4HC65_9AGAM|nr:uncharacterized protein F5891DRAFT_988543 [Suillus fuscotomentosus]KAG1886927.1 hypothetical protein F5891DRAFT_988543 [Suillus fuscotomentosus]
MWQRRARASRGMDNAAEKCQGELRDWQCSREVPGRVGGIDNAAEKCQGELRDWQCSREAPGRVGGIDNAAEKCQGELRDWQCSDCMVNRKHLVQRLDKRLCAGIESLIEKTKLLRANIIMIVALFIVIIIVSRTSPVHAFAQRFPTFQGFMYCRLRNRTGPWLM